MISSKHRHRARRLATQALCCLDAQGPHVLDLAVEFIRESHEPVEVLAIAQEMLHGAWGYHDRGGDASLTLQSLHWDLRRMAMVDRNILRLAIWELAEKKAPPKVIITEAVRLAKEFSTQESPRFINGVLDAVAKQFAPGDFEPQETQETDELAEDESESVESGDEDGQDLDE